MNLFDFEKPLLKKQMNEISLIELFGGIGSQLKALKNIGIKVKEHYLVEVDINATISNAAIHFDLDKHLNFNKEKKYMVEYLKTFNWWSNEKPYDIRKLKDDKLLKLYQAQKLTNNFGDIFQLKTLPKVDLITWSTPCQDFSLAGRRAGFDGKKGGLTFVTLKLFNKLKEQEKLPKYLLFENVAAIVDQTNITGFHLMLEELEKLGFENRVLRMNAKDYGIPQNRDRVFVLSIRNDIINDYQYQEPKPKKLKMKLKDFLEEKVDESYYLTKNKIKQITAWNSQKNPLENACTKDQDILQTITAKSNTSMNASMLLYKERIKVLEATKKGYKEAYDVDGMRIRKLTPKECFRLMGFDDKDVNKASKHMSNAALYKQAGNSIVVNVLEEIFKTILKGDKQ